MLKKIAILLSLFFLISSPTLAIETTGTFRIMNENNETIENKTVSFHEGETLLQVTKKAFIVEESNGNIVSINGIRSVPKNNLHWAAFVNGKFVNLGLDEVIVYANDDVLWALKNWDGEDILK
jgi:hypothetical protein